MNDRKYRHNWTWWVLHYIAKGQNVEISIKHHSRCSWSTRLLPTIVADISKYLNSWIINEKKDFIAPFYVIFLTKLYQKLCLWLKNKEIIWKLQNWFYIFFQNQNFLVLHLLQNFTYNCAIRYSISPPRSLDLDIFRFLTVDKNREKSHERFYINSSSSFVLCIAMLKGLILRFPWSLLF